MNEELGYVLETIRFKTSIYRDKMKRNLSFNDDDYYSNILNEYITDLQQENERLKDNWNELKEDISHILEVIEHNKDVIKVTSDEELAIYSLQEKMQEIERL